MQSFSIFFLSWLRSLGGDIGKPTPRYLSRHIRLINGLRPLISSDLIVTNIILSLNEILMRLLMLTQTVFSQGKLLADEFQASYCVFRMLSEITDRLSTNLMMS